MTLRNIFLKMAEEVKRYPNIVQLTNTLNKGFKQVADNINGGGSDVVVTPVYTSGEKLATITVDDVDNNIYMPNGEVKTMTGDSFTTVNGSLVDEMKVGFMPIQSGSGTPSPDNVRPISGHTDVESYLVGKNIYPYDRDTIKNNNSPTQWTDYTRTVNGITFTLNEDGTITATGTATSNANLYIFSPSTNDLVYFPIAHGKIFSGCPSGGSASTYLVKVALFKGNTSTSDYLPILNDTGTGVTIQDNAEYNYLRINIQIVNGYQCPTGGLTFKPMIRSADTSADFVPYNGRTYTTSLGDTYYGGDVEQVGGTGKATITYVDLGSLTWEYQSGYKRMRASISGAKLAPDSGSVAPNIMCENYKPVSMTVTQTENGTIALGATGYSYIYVHDEAYNDADVFKSAVSGVKFCYELATPTALTLTGQNITAEVGVNNVNAPGTNQEIMEVKYHQMMTIGDIVKLIE